MTEYVAVEVVERVMRVRLVRPEKKNALTPAMYDALAVALRRADTDPTVRVVWLTGSGDSFTSGNDVATFVERAKGAAEAAPPVFDFLETIATTRKPVIAAVNGMAVGVGATMLLHCDLVYAARSARLRFPFVDLGVFPEAASTILLPRLCGRHRAAELFLLADWIDAATARDLGIVNRVCDDDGLESDSLAVALRLAAKPPAAVRATKARMLDGLPTIVDRLRFEGPLFDDFVRSAEAQEAFAAFLEKRAPDFSRFS